MVPSTSCQELDAGQPASSSGTYGAIGSPIRVQYSTGVSSDDG